MTVETETLAIEPELIVPNWKTDVQYHRYQCSACGEQARNTYSEPYRTKMLEKRLCWNCSYWQEAEEKYTREHTTMTIIDGYVYGPGNRTSGKFRGMAGRRFDIEYIEPSVYAGQRITTFDLWSGSALPDNLKAKFPDTARFLGNAEKAKVGETTCWNPSERSGEPYPLPNTLRPTSSLTRPQSNTPEPRR